MKKQKKSKTKKIKEISLPMKFNLGLQKFEPELPLRKGKINKTVKRKRNWWAFWFIVIYLLILALILYLAFKYI